jgi:hypothetical protein
MEWEDYLIMPRDFEIPICKELELVSSASAKLKREYERTLGIPLSVFDALKRQDSVMDQIRSAMVLPSLRYPETIQMATLASFGKEMQAAKLASSFVTSLAETVARERILQNSVGLALARQATISKSVYAELDRINGITHHLREMSGLSVMSQIAGQGSVFSEMVGLKSLEAALKGIPAWMKPLSALQAVQPSWEIASSLGAVGIGRPTLIQDVIGSLHVERHKTISFEAVVQMMEVADEADDEIAERVLQLLRIYAGLFIELLAETKDWVKRQGLMAMLMLFLGTYTALEGRWTRIDADVQKDLAIKQDSNAHSEIAERDKELKKALAQFKQEHEKDRNLRVLVRSAPLLMTPEADGKIMRQLHPDDLVRVLDVKDGWAHVEVFQYSSEQLINGWINRRVLRVR